MVFWRYDDDDDNDNAVLEEHSKKNTKDVHALPTTTNAPTTVAAMNGRDDLVFVLIAADDDCLPVMIGYDRIFARLFLVLFVF